MLKRFFTKEYWLAPRLQWLVPGVVDESELSVRQIVARLVVGLITATWIAALPGYLAVIYMQQNGFFSYDFLIQAVFAQNIFVFVAALIFLGASLFLYGSLLYLVCGVADRRDKGKVSQQNRFLFWLFIALSAFAHFVIVQLAFLSESPASIVPPLVLCLFMAAYFASYIGRSFRASLIDWFKPFLFVILTALMPLSQLKLTSRFVATGLGMFKVGGGVKAVVRSKDKDQTAVASGQLLLLGPSTVYVRSADGHLHVIPMNDNTVVEIDGQHFVASDI